MFRELSAEVQFLVAAQLENADKANLIYTCHYHLVIPQLYENIPDAMYVLTQLVDTLVRNPSLQKYPRYIKIEAWDVGREAEPDLESELEGDEDSSTTQDEDGDEGEGDGDLITDVGLFCKHAREICLAEEDGGWCAQHIKKRYEDALIALLPTLALNLTRFEVQFPFYSRGWIQRVVN
ncbi:hypothetical protein BJX65DRAFT_286185 [Aspergillus insuetus]